MTPSKRTALRCSDLLSSRASASRQLFDPSEPPHCFTVNRFRVWLLVCCSREQMAALALKRLSGGSHQAPTDSTTTVRQGRMTDFVHTARVRYRLSRSRIMEWVGSPRYQPPRARWCMRLMFLLHVVCRDEVAKLRSQKHHQWHTTRAGRQVCMLAFVHIAG